MENIASVTVSACTPPNERPTAHIKRILPLRQVKEMMTSTMMTMMI